MLSGLGWEVTVQEVELPLDQFLRQRDVDVRAAEVAVDLRDLVLQDQVAAERVPGQLAGETVILVEVVAGVREDDLGSMRSFNFSKTSFTSPPT